MAAKKRKPKVKQDLLGDYVSMTHKVCKTYLEQVRQCPIFDLQKRLRLHEGSRSFDHDLTLEITEPWGGTLIDGDLIVGGNLFIEDREVPALLFVVGDLRAQNIFNLGCRIIVNGNVETGAFICSPRHHQPYRSAGVHVTGRLSADAIAGPISACDGATSQIFRSGQRHKKMDELGFFNDEARSFFDPQLMQGDALLLPRVREYLEQGRPLSSGTESSGQAESFLDEVPDDIKTLDLSGRRLSLLPDRLFELQQLEQLDLSDNELTGPDPRLATLTKLEDLNVQDNRWGSYDGLGVVVELAELRKLTVGPFNPSEVIAQLTKLESLDASEVGFPLHEAFFTCTNIRSLRIGSPRNIRSKDNDLPELLANFTKLERLVVGRGIYAVIPDALSQLSNLEHLELSCSFRKRGVPALDGLKKLNTFIFDGAPFDDNRLNDKWLKDILEALEGSSVTNLSLPRWGRKLKHRRATGKQIDRPALGTLPDNFGSLTKLVELDLTDNGLKELPESLFSLKLSRLDVRDNDLSADTLKRARGAFGEVVH